MKTDEFIISEKQKELDLKLVKYDLWATKAHVLMLSKQNLIQKTVVMNILKALFEIEKDYQKGVFVIDDSLGLHLTIESEVIKKIGEDGYFMHTARSRNDQVATCELLYLKENELYILELLLNMQKIFLNLSLQHIKTIMPGYTHMQPAKPTTFGQWCLSFFDMFEKCFESFQFIYNKYNLCPLGSAESYGTSWNIDREYTAKLLGFKNVWEIPQDAISSRGFAQLAALGVLKDIGIIISKIAADLLLFTTFEYGYVELGDIVAKQMTGATGSSIMPQKKNPDVLELLRSVSPQLTGYEFIVSSLLSNLPMGYNRDTREVKEYIELGCKKTQDSLISLSHVLESIKVKKEKMYKSVLQNYSLSADLADYIAQKTGLPYRKVYKVIGFLVKEKIAKAISITDVTNKEIQQLAKLRGIQIYLSDNELKKVLDPMVAVSKRLHRGGAAESVMKKIIVQRKKLLTQYELWIKCEWEKINIAKKKTQQEIQKIYK